MFRSVVDLKRLWRESHGRCGYPDCAASCLDMVDARTLFDNSLVRPVGAVKIDRSQEGVVGSDELILLCPEHQALLEHCPDMFSPEMLKMWKIRHHRRMRSRERAPDFDTSNDLFEFIAGIIDENRSVFEELRRSSGDDINAKHARLVWELKVLQVVIPNNRLILDIFNRHKHLLSQDEAAAVQRFWDRALKCERAAYSNEFPPPRHDDRLYDELQKVLVTI